MHELLAVGRKMIEAFISKSPAQHTKCMCSMQSCPTATVAVLRSANLKAKIQLTERLTVTEADKH